jgi:hypothetical protein
VGLAERVKFGWDLVKCEGLSLVPNHDTMKVCET